jgi:hypothetical protein
MLYDLRATVGATPRAGAEAAAERVQIHFRGTAGAGRLRW